MTDDAARTPLTFTRREFVVTTLAVGFTAAAGPVMAQTALATPATGLTAGEVQIPVSGGTMPAYRAMPEGGAKLPVVLVVQEIFGVHEYIKDVCRRFARLGYLAVAPELYARQGDGSKMTDIQQILENLTPEVPDAQVMADLDSAVAWAETTGAADTSRLGITGFCWGGRIVWLYAAHSPKLKAGVAWYGRLAGTASALAGRGGNERRAPPQAADRPRERARGAGARALRRCRRRYPAGGSGPDEGRPRGGEEPERDRGLPRRAARLPRRLPAELSAGRGRRRVVAAPGVVPVEGRRLSRAGSLRPPRV